VFATAEHTSEELHREAQVAEVLDLRLEEQLTMYHPDDLPFELEQLPDVFTRFRGKMEKRSEVRDPLPEPEALAVPAGLQSDGVPTLADLGVEAKVSDARGVLPFKGGAVAAWERLDHYFWETKKLRVYKKTRNGLLGADYSSKFSPWLALGCISPREIHAQVRAFEKEIEKNEDTYWLIFELIWRDYFRYVAMRYGNRIFHKRGIKQESPKWRQDRRAFEAWCEGRTKCDFVNANMRELAATGFMSNRGRQNVASYLVHDLGVDWRLGASWFEHHLLDHDPASNYGNWIYVAGVGNDPRPNRKFNTGGQAERYDADGKYRRHWSHATLELDLQ
jgi:deoxyribodipyrimidine photo-lyase